MSACRTWRVAAMAATRLRQRRYQRRRRRVLAHRSRWRHGGFSSPAAAVPAAAATAHKSTETTADLAAAAAACQRLLGGDWRVWRRWRRRRRRHHDARWLRRRHRRRRRPRRWRRRRRRIWRCDLRPAGRNPEPGRPDQRFRKHRCRRQRRIRRHTAGQSGQGIGSGIFLRGNGTLSLSGAGLSQVISDAIVDQTGAGGTAPMAELVCQERRGDDHPHRGQRLFRRDHRQRRRPAGQHRGPAGQHPEQRRRGLRAGRHRGTYAGNLSGTGAVTVRGSGAVTLAGTNTYSEARRSAAARCCSPRRQPRQGRQRHRLCTTARSADGFGRAEESVQPTRHDRHHRRDVRRRRCNPVTWSGQISGPARWSSPAHGALILSGVNYLLRRHECHRRHSAFHDRRQSGRSRHGDHVENGGAIGTTNGDARAASDEPQHHPGRRRRHHRRRQSPHLERQHHRRANSIKRGPGVLELTG